MSEMITPASAVAKALQALFWTYPTYSGDIPAAAALTVADPVPATKHRIELQPVGLVKLQRMVEAEADSRHRARLGEDGLIYHANGEVGIKASAEMYAQEVDGRDDEDEEAELSLGEWMCVHHGTGGGPGEDCPDCREHWGLDPVRPQ
ncbi:hypothetical protein [Streptomyces sp. CBMA156]|uniref:hypothetical protein n=1 Tax=Streptomyces sp. CBMA156 TaxID=1930280 RepID=UPI00166204C7|nr:hypothetical protein [Streptomyces sp. CBMA156]MBD0673981.1 hypothetical protein [Streptomyces sp. CBMA156]